MPSLDPDEPKLSGQAIRRAFEEIDMPQRELAGRLKMSAAHIGAVFSGKKPVSPTFQLRVMSIVRMAKLGILPVYVPVEPRDKKPAVGYCGAGANLPEDYEPAMPGTYTCAPAGSVEKVEEMRLRAERGEELWHPRDNKLMKRIGDD